MSESLDMRSAGAVLRRRRRVLLVAGALGIAAGLTFAVLQPPRYVSTTLVLLPTPASDSTGGLDADTEIKIIKSASLLEAAGESVRPKLAISEVEGRVQVKASTTQLIQIDATGGTTRSASSLSQAVANAFVQYHQQATSTISASATASLRDRQNKLQTSVNALQQEIMATTKRRDQEGVESTDGRKDSQLLAQLQSEQADSSLQLDKIKEQLQSGPATQSTGVSQPSVVQSASPAVQRSKIFSWISAAAIGLILASAIASGILLVLARNDRRVRLRDEIADALGTPVLASIRSRASKTSAGWSLLLQSYESGPVDEWAFRQLLRALTQGIATPQVNRRRDRSGRLDHPASITIVSLAGDVQGLAMGPQLASFTASRGVMTRLITAVGSEAAAPLWSACSAPRTGPIRENLLVGEVQPGESPDLTIVLAVIHPRTPDFGYSLRTERALIAVGAGAATGEDLARVAVAVDDAGGRLDGAVVADADADDRTSGRYMAEERAKQVALPMRMSGDPGGSRT